MAGKEIKTIQNYLKAFSSGSTEQYRNLLKEDVHIVYSSLGEFNGIEEAIAHVTIPEEFDDFTITMLNTISYPDGTDRVVSTIAQHMNYYEDVPYLYPVVYGGQYVFVVDSEDDRIRSITFQLDYQGENTYYLKHWNLSNGHNDYAAVKAVFSAERAYEEIMNRTISEEEKAKQLSRLYLTVWNTRDVSFIQKMSAPEVTFSREKTYSNGTLNGTLESLESYIKSVDDYYDLNEWGARINAAVKNEDGTISVEFQLLSPYRLGTKKLNSSNKFSSFYDEAGYIVFNSNWQVTSFSSAKVAEIYMNGFDVIEA
ncbi:MAG: hypothetical protein IJ225_10145 [Solobacterium sp.]|nr:hypothetical protein [Solobacterium sp.]